MRNKIQFICAVNNFVLKMMKRYAQLSIPIRKYQLNYIVNKTLLYEYLACEQRVCIKYNYN